MMKKFLYASLLTVLLITLIMQPQSANAEDVEDNNSAPLELSPNDINNLKSLGFTEEEISNMSEEEFKLNEGITGEVIEEKTKYYKVIETVKSENPPLKFSNPAQATIQSDSTIEEEINSVEIELTPEQYYAELEQVDSSEKPISIIGVPNKNSITTNSTTFEDNEKKSSYKTMTTSILKLSTGKYRVRLKVRWEEKMPKNRKIDVLGVGINSAQWRPAHGHYGKQTYNIYDTKNKTNTLGSASYGTTSNKWDYNVDGYALEMNLKDDISSSKQVSWIELDMYYTVTPLWEGLPKQLDAYSKYSHQETSYEITPTINFDGSGGYSISQTSKFTYTKDHVILKTK